MNPTPKEEGTQAAKQWKKYDANPYGENDRWHWEWLAGWAAQMEIQLLTK